MVARGSKLVCFLLLMASIPSARAGQTVRIVVRVPADTPATAPVFVAGSASSVGGWKPDGVKLVRQTDGSFVGDLSLEAGQMLEFKITRGSWQTVEKNADGSDRTNRTVDVKPDTKQIDVTVERWSSDGNAPSPKSSVVGTLELHNIESRALKQPRTIRVWLPPDYDGAARTRYPVLYMQDGQNCFDRATSAFGNEWEIDETLTKLINDRRIAPMIVVGIDNGLANRINEYTYHADAKRGGGQGAAYAEFLLNEVKPFVEKRYRAQTGLAHTFLGGSSLGGLISLEIARRHPGNFGGVIAMSPAIRWADEVFLKEIEQGAGGLAGARVWIDMGARENLPVAANEKQEAQNEQLVAAARRLDATLTKLRVKHSLMIDEEHPEHNEPAWASRFPRAITYILDVN